MFTTEGSTIFAICENVLDSSTGLGMVKGVAPGATVESLAAFTPELTKVPITMPIDSVKRISVNESNFCVRNFLMKLMDLLHSSAELQAGNIIAPRVQSCYFDGCNLRFNGFNSTKRTPPRMRAAPTAARRERPSPIIQYDVS